MSADLPHSDLSNIKDYSIIVEEYKGDYYSDPEDNSDVEFEISRGPQVRLFWNLDDFPVPPGSDLPKIRRRIKLALHRRGIHGALHIWSYGDELNLKNFGELDAWFSHTPSPPPPGWSISGQMCVDFFYILKPPDRSSVFVVITKEHPTSELHRVLRTLQSKFQRTVLTMDPQDCSFQNTDSLLERTLFVGGGDGGATWPVTKHFKPFEPLNTFESGVFWDARDCPFPVGWGATTIYNTIKSSFIERFRVTDNMSVKAYLDDPSELLLSNTCDSRIDFFRGGNTPARHEVMFHDILMWLVDHPEQGHLIVAGKLNKEMFLTLESLGLRGYSVFIVWPTKDPVPEFQWPGILLERVYGFGGKSFSDSDSHNPDPKRQKVGV